MCEMQKQVKNRANTERYRKQKREESHQLAGELDRLAIDNAQMKAQLTPEQAMQLSHDMDVRASVSLITPS